MIEAILVTVWAALIGILGAFGDGWSRGNRTDAHLKLLKLNQTLSLALWRWKHGPDAIMGLVDDSRNVETIYRQSRGV